MRVFVNCPPTTQAPLWAGTLDSADNSSPRSAVAVSSPFYARTNRGSERAGGLPGVTQPGECGKPGFDHEAFPESGQPPSAPPRSRCWPPTQVEQRAVGESWAAQPQPHPLQHGNYRKAGRSKTPPSQARRYWHPGLFPLVSRSDPLREGRREADSPLCGLFPRPHFPASSEPPDTPARRAAGLSWALCLPGRSGCSRRDLFLFPTQEPLRGRVKTLLSSRPFPAPSPPTWSKARVLSVAPAPRPSVRPLPLRSISYDHPCRLSCPHEPVRSSFRVTSFRSPDGPLKSGKPHR